jgi:SAM-dependent methyltransferase
MIAKIRHGLARLDVLIRSLHPVRLRYPAFGDLDAFCAGYAASQQRGPAARTLDLGCGSAPRNPFGAAVVCGVDLRAAQAPNVRYADLATEPIPFGDGSFDYVSAYDFIEHVPRVLYAPQRRAPFVVLMNEIDRVLRVGGVLLAVTPAFPFTRAFQDPTHVNIVTEDTFPSYFCAPQLQARIYGFQGCFTLVRQGWRRQHLITVLAKRDSARP